MLNLLHSYSISKQIGFTSRLLEQENILSIGLDSPAAQIRSYSNELIEPKHPFSAEEVLEKERS